MYDIICKRAVPNVITYTRGLSNFKICLIHDITCTRALPNGITCMMHNAACTRGLRNAVICKRGLLNV